MAATVPSRAPLHHCWKIAPSIRCRRLLVLATTLDRLVLGSQPFWNTHGRPVRFTSIAYDAPGIIRNARRILYGGHERNLPIGFDSIGAERIELTLDGPFTIDGQFFEPAPDRPLVLTAAASVRFVQTLTKAGLIPGSGRRTARLHAASASWLTTARRTRR